MDVQRFVDLFLAGDALRKTLAYLCNTVQGNVMDPITHTLCLMITTPVQIMLTQVGVAPFKDKNTSIFPYRLMNDEQKQFLRDFVAETETHVSGLIASVQIGGGCVLCKRVKRGTTLLDAGQVLSAFCQTVQTSKTHANPAIQRSICNIVIQRVGGQILLDKDTLQRVMKSMPGGVPPAPFPPAEADTPGVDRD